MLFETGVFFDDGDPSLRVESPGNVDTLRQPAWQLYTRNTKGMSFRDQALLEHMTLERDIAKLKATTAKAECESKWSRHHHIYMLIHC